MASLSDLPADTDNFVAELDSAVEAHMNWTRRIVRCAILRTAPGEDMFHPEAHILCRFGAWFKANRERFEALDAAATERVEAVHQTMHDAIRSICTHILEGQVGHSADLDTFEASQSELTTLLARFKTLSLSKAVRYDPLTELPLRYGIEKDFALCQKEAGRNNTLLYVVMIDVDHFKAVNDTYGHLVGDRVLRHLAGTLKRKLRGNEPLYRFGGEEFLWLLKCGSPEAAEQTAHRVVTTIASTPVRIADEKFLTLTVTLGLAHADLQEELSSAITRADHALYEGKRSGRNRYVIAHS